MVLFEIDTLDLAVTCILIVVVSSLICMAGKQFVKWVLAAALLFFIIRVLQGADNWGVFSNQTITEVKHTVATTGVYETVAHSAYLDRLWSTVDTVRVYVPVPGSRASVPVEPEPEPELTSGGWLSRFF